MKIAFDVTPITDSSGHKVRGAGFYVQHLKDALEGLDSKNEYTFFTSDQKINEENFDVIHFPYFEPFSRSLAVHKTKTIVTVHDLTPLVFPKLFPIGIRGSLNWFLQEKALQKADAIITDSESGKKDIEKLAGIDNDKIHIVPLAASSGFKNLKLSREVCDKIKKQYNLPDKFILYVGDVTANKNLPRLVYAVKQINIPLVLVGKALANKEYDYQNAWNRDLVQVQKETKNNDQFKILGFVPDNDLVMIYNLASVFVLPSLYEGFGLPVLEAMQCGCPVITTKNGSLVEVAGDAAYFVDPENVGSIAEGIQEVFNSQKLQKELSHKGLIQAKKFSWEKTAKETEGVYKLVAHR